MATPTREDYLKNDIWPHAFTDTEQTRPYMARLAPGMPLTEMTARLYYCVHCKKEWWSDTPRPEEPCPERTNKKEKMRLFS